MPTAPRFHRAYNIALGSLLLSVALPTIGILALALLATQGWQVFYRGTRIGEGGRLYQIVKFRTLEGRKAREITGSSVLPANSGIETPLGAFLRDTRLDELPQLFNVALGQMNVCGPRPVRPEIAAIQRAQIPGYDVRFRVKPGLIGHTQAYMHHGTSKKIRARYNRMLCRAPVRYRGELGMIALVGACVFARTVSKLSDEFAVAALGRDPDHRAVTAAAAVRLVVLDERGARYPVARVDRRTLALADMAALPGGAGAILEGQLAMTLPSGEQRVAAVSLAPIGGAAGRYAYMVRSDYAHHIISRYLWQAVVVPHRSQFWSAAIARRLRRLVAMRVWRPRGPSRPRLAR